MKRKVIVGIWIVVCLVLITRSGANVYRLWKAGERVTEAEKKLALVKDENQRLTKELEQAQTDEYMDRLVREKLGYGKPGEVVVVIPQELIENGELRIENEEVPNWRKWRRLYFGF